MISEHPGTAGLDDIVRKSLADDLPADVAAGMRERIDRFREGRPKPRTRSAAWSWMFSRSVWAVLSLLMLAVGILLQGSNASNPLAKRIASLKTAAGTIEPTRR